MSEKENKKEKIKKIIRKFKNDRDESIEDLKRAQADLLNFKKDESKKIEEATRRSKEDVFLKLLTVIDNFDRAQEEVKKKDESSDIIFGFLNIKKQLEAVLREEGVKSIETVGKEFDPHYHEAIEVIQGQEDESGTVVEELQRGYIINGKVLRPAKVKVAK